MKQRQLSNSIHEYNFPVQNLYFLVQIAHGKNVVANVVAISVALVEFATGYIAAIYGLKFNPFFIGIAFDLLGYDLLAYC